MSHKLSFCTVFDEAALTDDLLVQLVEVLKKQKESTNKKTDSEPGKDEEKDSTEGWYGKL